jgi:hypothetical protein
VFPVEAEAAAGMLVRLLADPVVVVGCTVISDQLEFSEKETKEAMALLTGPQVVVVVLEVPGATALALLFLTPMAVMVEQA